jgi:hypothetical protein
MQQSQTTPLSLLLLTISLLSTPSTALPQNNGLYTTAVAVTTPAVITAAPIAPTSAAPVNWETAVTWPAGCETWLNPCPAGALTSGVAPSPAAVTWPAGCQTWANPCPASAIISAASPYENPLTSYTTMTNSVGIITGMPPVATSAGGVASVLSEQSMAVATSSMMTMVSSGESSIVSPTASATQNASATTDNSFSQATFSGAAVANKAGAGLAVMALGMALVL